MLRAGNSGRRSGLLLARDPFDFTPVLHRNGRSSPLTSKRSARQRQAKSWELRAAMSMARLWREQGKRGEARNLLAPVYGWFTEGFDTLDLKEAKVLLDAARRLMGAKGALSSNTSVWTALNMRTECIPTRTGTYVVGPSCPINKRFSIAT